VFPAIVLFYSGEVAESPGGVVMDTGLLWTYIYLLPNLFVWPLS